MAIKVFGISLGLAALFILFRGFMWVTVLPGGLLWVFLLVALISGIVSIRHRTYQ